MKISKYLTAKKKNLPLSILIEKEKSNNNFMKMIIICKNDIFTKILIVFEIFDEEGFVMATKTVIHHKSASPA